MRRRLSHEDGFTLIELLVALSIGTVVILALFNLLDAVTPASRRITNRVDSEQRGRAGLEQMLQQLRSAVCIQNGTNAGGNATFVTPFATATDDEVTFYGDLAAETDVASATFKPEKRRLYYDPAGKRIMEETTPGQGTLPAITFPGAPQVRSVIEGVERTGTQPVFSFYKYAGAPAALQQVRPVAPADLPKIAQVRMAFDAVPTGPGADSQGGVSLEDSATLRVRTDFSGTNATNGPVCTV